MKLEITKLLKPYQKHFNFEDNIKKMGKNSKSKDGSYRFIVSGGGGAGLHYRFGPNGNIHHYIICDVSPQGNVKQQVVRFYDITKKAN